MARFDTVLGWFYVVPFNKAWLRPCFCSGSLIFVQELAEKLVKIVGNPTKPNGRQWLVKLLRFLWMDLAQRLNQPLNLRHLRSPQRHVWFVRFVLTVMMSWKALPLSHHTWVLAPSSFHQVEPRRDQLDACLCFPSMPEVWKPSPRSPGTVFTDVENPVGIGSFHWHGGYAWLHWYGWRFSCF